MSLQFVIMYVFMPPAALLLFLLIIPTPAFVQTRLVSLVQSIFNAHIPQQPNLKFVWGVITIVLISFIMCTLRIMAFDEKVEVQKEYLGHADIYLSAMKWRNERNWWIALYALTLYMFLYLYNHTLKGHLMTVDGLARARINADNKNADDKKDS